MTTVGYILDIFHLSLNQFIVVHKASLGIKIPLKRYRVQSIFQAFKRLLFED